MSNLELIERLCALLDAAQSIIREQAAMLEMHGASDASGDLERRRAALLADVESTI